MTSLPLRVLAPLLLVVGALGINRTSRRAPPPSCSPNEFLCSDGECIWKEWLCDTSDDCPNAEDEVGCPTDCSGQNQFRCDNNECVSKDMRCDGQNDCLDQTDERNCQTWPCYEFEVKCPHTYLCIENPALCDGDDDCGDGWDEVRDNCPSSPTHHT